MGRIQLLDTATANKIAAGEVVERPASVVKELIENSLDAGARSIFLRVENGGKDKITVGDDGEGMAEDDLLLAFQRHATSKIATAEDLHYITTLGFRGEALASIAAVSKIFICSRLKESTGGLALRLEAGNVVERQVVGCSRGTTIEVTDLFFNAPARKKFLFNTSRETAAISEIVHRLALAHNKVKFTYYSGERMLLSTPGNNSMLEVITAIYGYELAEKLLPLTFEDGQYLIRGFISPPTVHRATANGITVLINGRFIKDSSLIDTIRAAYGSRIPRGRFPLAVVELRLDPGTIDVNVHPQKLSVKFDQPELIHSFLNKALNKALSVSGTAANYVPSIKFTERKNDRQELINSNDSQDQMSFNLHTGVGKPKPVSQPKVIHEAEELVHEDKSQPHLPAMRVVGQFQAGYIVAEAGDELYIIDQHGAHERVLFERYCQENKISYSQLTVPQTITFTADEAEYLVNCIFLLQKFGFILEHFGGNTFLLRGVPEFATTADGVTILRDVIQLVAAGKQVREQELKKEMLLQLSCKGAVKAGQYLEAAEMENLLRQLANSDYPYSCPHGRPIIIKLTLRELQKLFLRQE